MGPANVGGSISHIPLRNLVSHEREQEICIFLLCSFSIFCSHSLLYLLLALLRSFPIKCKSRINCKTPHASFLARISIPIYVIIYNFLISQLWHSFRLTWQEGLSECFFPKLLSGYSWKVENMSYSPAIYACCSLHSGCNIKLFKMENVLLLSKWLNLLTN